ncbi:hypothetical protein HanRHA438_Chr09g0403231 [Helianthus annuus]|nr:hypothetical protein HanRHA438_Chr09g0403231 [Helianthus annuus]
MTGCKALLLNFFAHGWDDISFGNGSKSNMLGSRIVQTDKLKFENIDLVDNMKFNLLSVS